MKSLLINLYHLLKEYFFITIPGKYKKEFNKVLQNVNLPRIKFVNIFVLIISCVLMLIARNGVYLRLYAGLFLLMLLWFPLLYKSNPEQKRIRYIQISYDYIFPFILMLWGLAVSFQDRDLVAFVIIACIISVIVVRDPIKTIIVYGFTYLIFILLTPYYFTANLLSGYYINASILFIFSIIASRMLYLNKLNDFVNKKIVENKNNQLQKVNNKLQNVNKEISKKTGQIQSLFDNIEQGLLTFNENFIIEEQYSRECINIFGDDIAGKYYPEVIYPDDEEQKELIERILKKTSELSGIDAEVYLSLMPEEFQVNDKELSVNYKIIESDTITRYMVIIKDITEKKALENKMEEEKNTLRMVLQAVVYYNDFFECIRDYQDFCQRRIFYILQKEDLQKALIKIFKSFHTFKGNFYQLHMKNIADKIHEFEDKLNNLYENTDLMTEEECINFFKNIDMLAWLDEEIIVLKEILGEKYFDKENVLMVDADNLLALETKFYAVLSENQCEVLIPEIRRLRYRPAKEMFKTYGLHIERLAQKLFKSVNPLKVQGGEMLICPEKYNGFIKSLVHLFRNSMDHGIECVEERLRKGKEPEGNIFCKIDTINNKLVIEIGDDGRGIDLTQIKNKALEKEIYTADEIEQLSNQEIIELIFQEQFTTTDRITELSGRGLGLSAVKNEVEKLSGSIKIITERDKGTKFSFSLPYQDINTINEIPARTIMDYFVEKMTVSFRDELDIYITDCQCSNNKLVENISLNEHSISLKVNDDRKYTFVLSADSRMALKILYNIYIGEIGENVERYIEDALSEMLNVVVGNIIKKIFKNSDRAAMGTPEVIDNIDGEDYEYKWQYEVESEIGKLKLFLLLPENE